MSHNVYFASNNTQNAQKPQNSVSNPNFLIFDNFHFLAPYPITSWDNTTPP